MNGKLPPCPSRGDAGHGRCARDIDVRVHAGVDRGCRGNGGNGIVEANIIYDYHVGVVI